MSNKKDTSKKADPESNRSKRRKVRGIELNSLSSRSNRRAASRLATRIAMYKKACAATLTPQQYTEPGTTKHW